MKLIIFRHGLAVEREEFIKRKLDDSMRPLTAKGVEKTRDVAEALIHWQEDVDMIVSSPYVRAMQTAEILAEVYQKRKIHQSNELVPQAPPMAFAQWLKTQTQKASTIIAVGHEPQLSVFASWCLAGFTTSFIDLKKSGALCLEFESFDDIEPRCADLKWYVNPKTL